MERIAVFAGSFDPFTNGHFDIVNRGLKLFDKIIIAIGHNSYKQRYFPLEMMTEKIKEAFKNQPMISVVTYSELTASFVKRYNANFLLRGLRNTTDFEYENSIAQVNRYLNEHLESVFLITSPEYAAINSSILREVHRYRGDINSFLPYKI